MNTGQSSTVNTTTSTTTTTVEIVKLRLEQLWCLANTLSIQSPSLSSHYLRLLLRLARDNEIKLANGFYQRVCIGCATLYLPSINCKIVAVTCSKMRKFIKEKKEEEKEKKKEKKGGGSCRFLKASRYMSLPDGLTRLQNDKTSLLTTYQCTSCNLITIFDLYPLEFNEQLTMTKASEDPKTKQQNQQTQKKQLQGLQKVLKKSETTTSKSSGLDLESFLKGL